MPKIDFVFANSADPDEMFCLRPFIWDYTVCNYLLGVSSLQRVRTAIWRLLFGPSSLIVIVFFSWIKFLSIFSGNMRTTTEERAPVGSRSFAQHGISEYKFREQDILTRHSTATGKWWVGNVKMLITAKPVYDQGSRYRSPLSQNAKK